VKSVPYKRASITRGYVRDLYKYVYVRDRVTGLRIWLTWRHWLE